MGIDFLGTLDGQGPSSIKAPCQLGCRILAIAPGIALPSLWVACGRQPIKSIPIHVFWIKWNISERDPIFQLDSNSA